MRVALKTSSSTPNNQTAKMRAPTTLRQRPDQRARTAHASNPTPALRPDLVPLLALRQRAYARQQVVAGSVQIPKLALRAAAPQQRLGPQLAIRVRVREGGGCGERGVVGAARVQVRQRAVAPELRAVGRQLQGALKEADGILDVAWAFGWRGRVHLSVAYGNQPANWMPLANPPTLPPPRAPHLA